MDNKNPNTDDYSFKRDYKKSGAKSRYGKKQKRDSFLRVLGKLGGLAVLFVVVFFTVTLLLDLSHLPTDISNKAVDTSAPVPTSSETTTIPVEKNNEALVIKAMTMEDDALKSEATVKEWIDKAKSMQVTGAVIDFKRADGTLAFTTENSIAKEVGATKKAIVNLSNAIKQLKEAQMTVIANIECFRDPLAPLEKGELGVYYMNTDGLWFDNKPSAGGKTWLNPYSKDAQTYLLDIIKESMQLGADRVLLNGVQFPDGYALDLATFEGEDTGASRNATLVAFLEDAAKTAGSSDKLIIGMSGDGALNGSSTAYDGNLLDSNMKVAAPDFTFDSLPDQIKIGNTTLSATNDKNKILQEAPKHLVARAKLGHESPMALMPVITADSSVSKEALDEVIKALNNVGIQGYILDI